MLLIARQIRSSQPLEEANIVAKRCFQRPGRRIGKQVSCRRAPSSIQLVCVLPLGLQTHLLALLPPQLPAPLEVHFLHGCDLRGRRDIVSATPFSGRKRRQTMNDTTAGSAVQQSLSFPHLHPPSPPPPRTG